jgi:transcription initiation factor IIE alpha subunit
MTTATAPCRADDCATALGILASAPAEGLTQEELALATGWSLRDVNSVLCDLGSRIKNHKVRSKDTRKNVVRYYLNLPGA